MFAGRKKELSYLEESYSQDGSRIIVMYGYRGVGKTTLLKRFAEKKDLTYFLARPCSDEEERLIWNRECGGDSVDPEMQEVPSYTDILGRLISAGGGKKILAIDEFQNIIRYSPDFMEQLVNFINASDTQIFCVLLSSSISFVENDLVPRIGNMIKMFYIWHWNDNDVERVQEDYSSKWLGVVTAWTQSRYL